jgi:ribosomal protein S18 acetylase RimI-like enzyme
MIVRDRSDADLGACAALAGAVHESDGYPRYLPGDLRSFIASRDAYQAWVAEQDGRVVGHVALHSRSSGAAVAVAREALGQPPERLGFIARLLVSPDARGAGAGRALLEVATQAAIGRGLSPVLDVDATAAPAIALYERCGWTRAGQITARFSDGNELTEFVYLGPRPADADAWDSAARRASEHPVTRA